MTHTDIQTPPGGGLTRRTLAKGLAWSAPVIALAPAAHAYSTSVPNVTIIGGATKLPGNSCCTPAAWPGPGPCPYFKQSYRYYFTAFNPPGKDACFVVTKVKLDVTVNAAGVVDPTSGSNATGYKIFTNNPTPTESPGCACAAVAGKLANQSIFLPAGCTVLFTIDAGYTGSPNTDMYFEYAIYSASANPPPPNTYTNNCNAPVIPSSASCDADFPLLTGQATGTPVDGGCAPY